MPIPMLRPNPAGPKGGPGRGHANPPGPMGGPGRGRFQAPTSDRSTDTYTGSTDATQGAHRPRRRPNPPGVIGGPGAGPRFHDGQPNHPPRPLPPRPQGAWGQPDTWQPQQGVSATLRLPLPPLPFMMRPASIEATATTP